jgi:16S rRNA pseudouridine516 synthase
MLNKPSGYLSAVDDKKGSYRMRPSGTGDVPYQAVSCGRHDKDAEGLLLLTNDGDNSHKITSPKKKIVKTYYVETDGKIPAEAVKLYSRGLTLKDGRSVCPERFIIQSSGGVSSALIKITKEYTIGQADDGAQQGARFGI